MRRYSNPPGTPVDLGVLLDASLACNTIEIKIGPRQPQRRLREADVARLVEDFVAGASVGDLITAYGVNRTTVYAHLDRNEIARPRREGKLSPAQVQRLTEFHRRSTPIAAVASQMGVGEETVRRAFRQMTIERRQG